MIAYIRLLAAMLPMRILRMILLLATASYSSYACMCSEIDLKKKFDESEFVFVGLAIQNIHIDTTVAKLLDQNKWGIRLSFKIEKLFKGNIKSSIIAIIQDGNSCSMAFGLGKRYLVFGSKRTKIFEHNLEMEDSHWMDTLKADVLEQVMQARKLDSEQEQRFENKIMNEFELMINTNLCASFYEKSVLYKKFIRRIRTAGNK